MEITLTLTLEEANTVLAALGQLPTNTGVYPLMKKIKEQGDAQVPPPAEEPAAEESTEQSADTTA